MFKPIDPNRTYRGAQEIFYALLASVEPKGAAPNDNLFTQTKELQYVFRNLAARPDEVEPLVEADNPFQWRLPLGDNFGFQEALVLKGQQLQRVCDAAMVAYALETNQYRKADFIADDRPLPHAIVALRNAFVVELGNSIPAHERLTFQTTTAERHLKELGAAARYVSKLHNMALRQHLDPSGKESLTTAIETVEASFKQLGAELPALEEMKNLMVEAGMDIERARIAHGVHSHLVERVIEGHARAYLEGKRSGAARSQ